MLLYWKRFSHLWLEDFLFHPDSLCSFLTGKQHRPFLKAISVPVVRVLNWYMACSSVGKIFSVKLFSSKVGKQELITWLDFSLGSLFISDWDFY